MSLAWLFRLAERWGDLALPLLIVAVGGGAYAVALGATEGGFVRAELPYRQIVGTVALFVLLPAYLVALAPRLHRGTIASLESLGDLPRDDDRQVVMHRLDHLGPAVWPCIAVGVMFGVGQNPVFFQQIFETGQIYMLDIAFLAGAVGLWVVIGILLCWRVSSSAAVSRLGDRMPLDLYELHRLAPLARIASTDILMVVGAVALSALQSLDAEFRFGNYRPTVFVGAPAAVILFLLPLWGAHRNLQRAKTERVRTLRAEIEGADRGDLSRLELLLAHLERVRSLPTWPIDFEIVARILGYVVIPPLAWVAAAFVENWIDRF